MKPTLKRHEFVFSSLSSKTSTTALTTTSKSWFISSGDGPVPLVAAVGPGTISCWHNSCRSSHATRSRHWSKLSKTLLTTWENKCFTTILVLGTYIWICFLKLRKIISLPVCSLAAYYQRHQLRKLNPAGLSSVGVFELDESSSNYLKDHRAWAALLGFASNVDAPTVESIFVSGRNGHK